MVQFNVPSCFSDDCDCQGSPPPGAFCPYGDCFSCIPNECDGPKCCCCSSIDIVLDIRARCYDRVFFSCNQDGTSAGPDADGGETPFPANCDVCFDACSRALGGDDACASISLPVAGFDPSPPNWYNFPPEVGPCSCDCASFEDPSNTSSPCNLTCVTCANLKCNANVEVVSTDCSYQFNLTPSTGCCGTPSITDVVFAIDYSVSMGSAIDSVITAAGDFADGLALTGAQARFGLLVYGKDSSCVIQDSDIFRFGTDTLTTDVEEFKAAMTSSLPLSGGSEPDFQAAFVALQTYPWEGVENLIFVIGDETVDGDCPMSGQPSSSELIDLANTLGVTAITIQPFVNGIGEDSRKTDFSTNTSGGRDFDIALDFSILIDELNLNVFGASCDCLDQTPIPVELCRGGIGADPLNPECIDSTVDIPIGICVEQDNSDCTVCQDPLTFLVCGEIVVVEPDQETINLVCCGELGGGCNCPEVTTPEEGCCGVACNGIDICPPIYNSLEDAINGIWCECHSSDEFVVVTPGCSRCEVPDPSDPDYADLDIDAIENCVIKVPDGQGGWNEISRNQVVAEIEAAWAADCVKPPIDPPPPISAECLPNCDRTDECIVGERSCGSDDIRTCREVACSHSGCTSVRNPSTAILNNGIGLVAYESMSDNSVIKIDQLNTSVPAKILPNRRTNYGRLQHQIRWEEDALGFSIGKLYYYDDIPSHFMNGVNAQPGENVLVDLIVFRSGPLENQCFPLHVEPVGSDDLGDYIKFIVPLDVGLSFPFMSLDDNYNTEWFILDADDQGLTGSATEVKDTPGSQFLLDPNDVDAALELSPHVHDGRPVPVAYPSLAVARNYMNAIENSHYVYLVYQALEDSKWNVYMREIRLSEYSREDQIATNASFRPLAELGISELIYRVVCANDTCEIFGNDFIAARSVTMEVTLTDGRDVFNHMHNVLDEASQSWTICPGEPSGDFPKRKVFAQLSHSAVVNRCPDQFEFNSIFYGWEVGDEFGVPFTELTSNDLFLLLQKPNDSSIAIGENTVTVSGITITSSQVGAIWHEDPTSDTWESLDDPGFQEMLKYKGLDVSEPIPIAEFEEGHCTHPIVRVNSNNEVFVAYECTDPLVHQIHLVGTVTPSTSFPLGVFVPKNLDANLDYFLSPSDFRSRTPITLAGEGINQLPDMFIDANDVIHLTWQSNRDNYWEIYAADSDESFRPVRITSVDSKSLKPSITGDDFGNIHIVWHDNRFGNWEIMMAYRLDDRPLTLVEQDPYMAGVRNLGYSHSTDMIPLTLTNPSSTDVLCISDLFVRFYKDRLLGEQAFDIFQSEFPQAFQIPGMVEADKKSADIVYPWEISSAFLIFPSQFARSIVDTGLSNAIVKSFSVTFDLGFEPTFIRFSAGNTEQIARDADPGSNIDPDEGTKIDWIDMRGYVSGTELVLADTPSFSFGSNPELSGRYVLAIMSSNLGLPHDVADLVKITLNIERSERVCLGPSETITGFLDLTPSIRVNKEGNDFVETPLPVGINRNQVYYISTIGLQDNGQILAFDDPKRSVSCESCTGKKESWSSATCSMSIPLANLTNFDQGTRFANIRVRFYSDSTGLDLVAQFEAFKDKDGNLECFTTGDNEPAQDIWQDQGLEILLGKKRSVTLFPLLNEETGLVCGVTYWVEVSTCYGTAESPCGRDNLERIDFIRWTCSCGAPRWEEQFGEAPENLREVVQWRASGSGLSDTRLTETGSTVDNYNPKIQLRSDLTGLVLYESNRDNDNLLVSENKVHSLYATAFSISPGLNMYASGAEDITSQLTGLLIKSDIPVTACGGTDCDDTGPAMEGRNPSFSLDQYDNIFLASEKISDQTACEELTEDKQRSITVHRCGILSKNLIFSPEDQDGSGNFPCDASEILGKTAPLITDKTFKKIIRMARVTNEFAKYHIVRSKKPAAVVDQCGIEIEIITEPDTIAVRIKNESEVWSTWYPFNSQIGSNTIRIPWVLSALSGIKNLTIEAATYQGLAASYSIQIIADYKGIDHTVSFYRSSDPGFPVPSLGEVSVSDLLNVLNTESQVFNETNRLNELKGIPVAGIRQPTTVLNSETGGNDIVRELREYILIELIPAQSYLDSLDLTKSVNYPVFDVLQQGAEDFFSLPTIYDSSSQTFRGAFPIQKDNETFFKDGLSFIIAHFKNDCSDLSVSVLGTEEYTRDSLNLVVPSTRVSPGEMATEEDVWSSERDKAGNVKNKISIRGTEDPYFVFGDPNYRLGKQDE